MSVPQADKTSLHEIMNGKNVVFFFLFFFSILHVTRRSFLSLGSWSCFLILKTSYRALVTLIVYGNSKIRSLVPCVM